MQRFLITKGATSVILPISIYDSSSTTGGKLTGLVFNTASLTAYYNRSGAAGAAVAITLVTATKGTWTSSGFIAIDGTNMPGDYELHIPDAALATGADTVMVQLKGAANMVPVNILIDLKAVNLQDSVRGGMTAMPNVASGSAGAIPTTGTGANQISLSSGLVTLAGVTHTGAVIPTVTTLTGHTAQTGDSFARIGVTGSGLTSLASQASVDAVDNFVDTEIADIQARLPAALVGGRMDASVGAMAANVLTAAATAADFGTEVAVAVWDEATAGHITAGTFGVSVKDILVDTAEIGAAGAGLTNINLPNQTMDIVGNITGNLSGSVGSVTAGVSVAAGGVAATSFAAGALDAAAIATDAGAEIADAVLLRKLDRTGTGTDAAQERTVVNALRAIRNKVSVAAGTATITKEDDTTTAWTSAIATTAGNPISSSDPT